jgi:hypothetical protein
MAMKIILILAPVNIEMLSIKPVAVPHRIGEIESREDQKNTNRPMKGGDLF